MGVSAEIMIMEVRTSTRFLAPRRKKSGGTGCFLLSCVGGKAVSFKRRIHFAAFFFCGVGEENGSFWAGSTAIFSRSD